MPQSRFGDDAVDVPLPASSSFGDAAIEPSPESAARTNEGIGGLEAFTIAAGRGLTKIGRGLGIAEPESAATTNAFKGLQEEMPITTGAGEILGEAAPFLIPGTGVGAIASTGGRIAASAGIGALEGGLISRGEGGDLGQTLSNAGFGAVIAGTLEAALPVLGRLGGKLVRKATGNSPRGPLFDAKGIPKAELTNALEKLGVSLNDFGKDSLLVLEKQAAGADIEQALRQSRFEELGVPSSKGNVSQDFAQQSEEERLISMASAEGGEPMRQFALEQSEAFQGVVSDYVDSLGVPANTGQSLKDALGGRLKNLKARKNELYRQVAENSPEIGNAPIFTDTISESLPKANELRRMSRIQGNSIDAITDLMTEFGIDRSDEALEKFAKSGGEVMPLTLNNAEEFRQALNQLRGGQSPGERITDSIAGRVIKALDGELDELDSVLMDTNSVDASLLAPLREARSTVQRIKTEFSPQSIVGRLINTRPDGRTPIIEASRAYDAILGKNTPIEHLERTIKSLSDSGADGEKALKNLQATTVLRALDAALSSPTRKTSGIQTIGYNQFAKSLDGVGAERLDMLFANNKGALSRLRTIKAAADDITPTAKATPRGSAPIILDALNRFGRTPGLAAVVDLAKFVVNAGSDDRSVRRALDNRPEFKQAALTLQAEFPALASVLGVAVLNKEDK